MRLISPLAAILMMTACSSPSPVATEKKLSEALARADAAEKKLAAVEQRATPPPAEGAAPAPAQAPPVQPKPRLVAPGTVLVVRTTTLLSTKTAKPQDTFTAHLVQPLMADGVVVLPKGTTVTGRVNYSDAGGRIKGRASLGVTLKAISGTDGRWYPITTSAASQVARSGVKGDAVKMGVSSGIGAAIGAIAGGGKGAAIGAGAGAAGGGGVVLATRGPAAEIAPESVLRFTLARALVIR